MSILDPSSLLGYGVKKWVPRPLVTVCGVCSSPATDVQHYGSISCYSCRAFFRRSVGNGKTYTTCTRQTDNCTFDPVNRTNCKKCRLRKCIEIGMRPEKVDRTTRKRNQVKSSSSQSGSPPSSESGEVGATIVEAPQPSTEQNLNWANLSISDNAEKSHVDIEQLVDDCFAEEFAFQANSSSFPTATTTSLPSSPDTQFGSPLTMSPFSVTSGQSIGSPVLDQHSDNNSPIEYTNNYTTVGSPSVRGFSIIQRYSPHNGGHIQSSPPATMASLCLSPDEEIVARQLQEEIGQPPPGGGGMVEQRPFGCARGGVIQHTDYYPEQPTIAWDTSDRLSVNLDKTIVACEWGSQDSGLIGATWDSTGDELSTLSSYCQSNPVTAVENEGQDNNLVPIISNIHSCNPIEKTIIYPTPDLELTFEEEFKIHELVVVKEQMVSRFFLFLTNLPRFDEMFRNFLTEINQQPKTIKHCFPQSAMGSLARFYPLFKEKILEVTAPIFDDCGAIADEDIKNELLKFSLPATHIVQRAFLVGNRDKEYFLPQHKAAGSYSEKLHRAYNLVVQTDKEHRHIRSFDPLSLDIFTSPWAENVIDELKFEDTTISLGNIVKDDVKLGSLFSLLILFTPGAECRQEIRENVVLRRIQREISLLLYRYLKYKYSSQDAASNYTSTLFRLVGDIHECRDIHINRRINRFPDLFSPDLEHLLSSQHLTRF